MSDGPVRIVRGSSGTERWLLTTAIGGDYFESWSATVRPFWEAYADRHGLGIAVVVGDVFELDEPELNGAWQKLLAPRALKSVLGSEFRCVLADTDVVISPRAPDIFQVVSPGNIGVVSQYRDLPLEYLALRRRIAFLRRTFMDHNFPLESALVAEPRAMLQAAGLQEHDDFFCSGVVVVDSLHHAELFAEWYCAAPTGQEYTAIDWGEELWLNSCVQGRKDTQWLEYSWQALWLYEVATSYPFLYSSEVDAQVARWCLGSSLLRHHFLHLAGRWEQDLVGRLSPEFPGVSTFIEIAGQILLHEAMRLQGTPRGVLLPNSHE